MTWGSQTLKSCLTVGAICGMMMQGLSPGYAQYASVPESDSRTVAEPEGGMVGESATTITPSLRLAERYDSNVLFSPGGKFEDYVTTVSPQARLIHRSHMVEAVIGGGATGEVYVNNPGLNYVGGNGFLDLDIERTLNRFVRGVGLRVSDIVSYTPQPPAFAAPTGGSRLPEPLVEGLQARRANSFTNTATVEASYFFSPYIGVKSTYIDSRIRFGKGIPTPDGIVASGEFINTNYQTLSSGLEGRPSLTDTISITHQYRKASFSSSGSESRGFSTQGVMATWSREITPSIRATVDGGLSIVSRGNGIYPLGGASLEWRGHYTTVMVSYSRSIGPSFVLAATALVSHVVRGSVTHKLAEDLSLSLAGSYAVHQSVPDSSLTHFESHSVTPGLEYKIGPNTKATLSYTRNGFQRTFVGRSLDFNRDMVMLGVLYEWR